MCDCCEAEGRNPEFHTGSLKILRAKLFKIYVGKTASVKLCRLCDIELFSLGEIRFLENHYKFTKKLAHNQRNFT